MISMPINLWHKDWIAEYADKFSDAVRNQLLTLKDKQMRSINKQAYNQVLNSLSYINNRSKTKEESQKLKEVLGLSICKRCLKSEFLDLRIQGMKELN